MSSTATEGRIFARQGPEDLAVYNADDPIVRELAAQARCRKQGYSLAAAGEKTDRPAARIQDGRLFVDDPRWPAQGLDLSVTKLLGDHNRQNIAAAALAALDVGADAAAIAGALEQFVPLAHRLEPVATVQGIQFVNDSKATNVDAVRRALACFDRPVVLIMGGRNKGYDFAPLADEVRRRVRKLVVMGEAAGQILASLGHLPPDGAAKAASMADAVHTARQAARSGDTVLLSPGCASFDMYANYAARGDDFRRQVEALL